MKLKPIQDLQVFEFENFRVSVVHAQIHAFKTRTEAKREAC